MYILSPSLSPFLLFSLSLSPFPPPPLSLSLSLSFFFSLPPSLLSPDDADESYDDQNLPFRKTQSMRATANRRIQIVDSLRQRRLSNSSLDREPMKPSQFKNEDDLTRNFQIQREWQVYVKMDKRVPGTK